MVNLIFYTDNVAADSQLSSELCDALRKVLRTAREAAQLSLGQLAVISGLNRQAITFIEQGERRPTAETFARLALALGMRPSEAWRQAEDALPAREWKAYSARRGDRV